VPVVDWLNQNANRDYPFAPADFEVSAGALDGKAAFSDAGFTLGVASAFEHSRDHVYLERYYKTATTIQFVFRLWYGEDADYAAMQCYEWVFEFPLDAPLGATVYAVPTRIIAPGRLGSENPEMGLGFLSVGNLDMALTAAVDGNVTLVNLPAIEPALLQSNVNTFVNKLRAANEERPCPPVCDCDSSSSSSSSGSSDSSSSSSSKSSSSGCEDPDAPEPASLTAPTRLPLPGGRFTEAVKLKPGYNCAIDVDEASNIVTVRSKLYGGEGMQCEDLRIEDDGEPVPETCVGCDELVYAVNNYGYDVERLQLAGGQGVLVLPDPENHRVVVMLEDDGICEVGA
jgi:hypothetical protein